MKQEQIHLGNLKQRFDVTKYNTKILSLGQSAYGEFTKEGKCTSHRHFMLDSPTNTKNTDSRYQSSWNTTALPRQLAERAAGLYGGYAVETGKRIEMK
jgi:hypothetical protein